MPTPQDGESKKDYLSRCMGYKDMQKYPSDQRYAICNSMWNKAKGKKSDTSRVLIRMALSDLEIREDGETPGVCGHVNATVMRYGVVDAYHTMFKRGCMDKTKRGKVKAGKVQVYLDHAYGVRTHVGVVRSLDTRSTDNVDEERATLDLFDTADGRNAKEYVSAVLAAKAFTGVSIGFYTRDMVPIDDKEKGRIYKYTDIEVEEVSITPRPAVPGAAVTGVRYDMAANVFDMEALRQLRARIGEEAFQELLLRTSPDEGDEVVEEEPSGDAETPDDQSDADEAQDDASTESDQPTEQYASVEDRIRAVRESYATEEA